MIEDSCREEKAGTRSLTRTGWWWWGRNFGIVRDYGEVQRVESEQDSMSGLCRASAAVVRYLKC